VKILAGPDLAELLPPTPQPAEKKLQVVERSLGCALIVSIASKPERGEQYSVIIGTSRGWTSGWTSGWDTGLARRRSQTSKPDSSQARPNDNEVGLVLREGRRNLAGKGRANVRNVEARRRTPEGAEPSRISSSVPVI
jgi:hypothetical protein